MKTFLTVLITCLTLFAVAAASLLVWQHQKHRKLAANNAQLIGKLNASRETATTLIIEKKRLAERLTSLEASEEELKRRVESLESTANTAAETKPQPYRVRAFMGQDNIGEAWIIPHNVTWDTEARRYLFEPVLSIDESAKHYFTAYRTNTVEREVYTTEVVQENYAYPYFYYVTPGRPGKPGRPPVKPELPIAPQSPEPEMTPQPDARARVFAPPMTIINSRPQVMKNPATSPVNQRVFAP